MLRWGGFRVGFGWLGRCGFCLFVIRARVADLGGYTSGLLGEIFCVFGVVGELIFFVVLGDIEFGVELELVSFLEHFEIFGRILNNVGGLISEYFAGEVGQNLLEPCRHWVFL